MTVKGKGVPSKPKGNSFQLDNKGGGPGNKMPVNFAENNVQPQPTNSSLAAMGYKNKISKKV